MNRLFKIKVNSCAILFFITVSFSNCQKAQDKSIGYVITDDDIRFGASILQGEDYTAQFDVFISEDELDGKIQKIIELKPEPVDFKNLSRTCSDGIKWEDVILVHSSLNVAKVIKKRMQDYQYNCITVKVASFSTLPGDSINYVVYTKRCIE